VISLSNSESSTMRKPIITAFLLVVTFLTTVVAGDSLAISNSGSILPPLMPSWNPDVSCMAQDVTLHDILGARYPNQSSIGSNYRTGNDTGGIGMTANGDANMEKRSLTPPCSVLNVDGVRVTTFVEVDNVWIGQLVIEQDDCTNFTGGVVIGVLCDNTGNLYETSGAVGSSCTGTYDAIVNNTMPHSNACVHGEMDKWWFNGGQIGLTPTFPACSVGTHCDNATLATMLATGPINVDVQGFIYWDGACESITNCPWHWEIHPWTAWRVH